MIVRNSCRCLKCGDEIESRHRHDFVWCKCGTIFTDGGQEYIRRGGDFYSIEDTSIVEERRKIAAERGHPIVERYPHCDELVLHVPGTCRYCDAPEFAPLHDERVAYGISHTGASDGRVLCPSEENRPLAVIERWPGNHAYPWSRWFDARSAAMLSGGYIERVDGMTILTRKLRRLGFNLETSLHLSAGM